MIEQIVKIISDYREDDLFVKIDEAHVQRWINQFDEGDREFILNELLYILPKSYLSKSAALDELDTLLETLAEDYKYDTIENFLDHTVFLRCQDDYKSQSQLLLFLDQLLEREYGTSIDNCGNKEVRNWLYIDDILASGGTYKRDIQQKIEEYGKSEFQKNNIQIISIFFFLHEWGKRNVLYNLQRNLGYSLTDRAKFYRVFTISNDPIINKYNKNPTFNHTYPLQTQEGVEFLNFIEKAFERSYPMTNDQYAFRSESMPTKEDFFSSPDNRDRYEKIIVQKGIEIIKNIDNLRVQAIRPLGFTQPAYKTLGTGSHCFTWRNISNTCPLVYWWEANWYPLFSVQNRGR
ncbi:hypothetical protein [Spirosoma sp. 209]|uniref:phosphoribosyltransferase-like protein n=1 Tax=Spirosoma sp. 209 TaxID=1955701 RepID=UPI00098CFD1B|nr:hypothetical protein [Spirosoma sp. 209]